MDTLESGTASHFIFRARFHVALHGDTLRSGFGVFFEDNRPRYGRMGWEEDMGYRVGGTQYPKPSQTLVCRTVVVEKN